MDKSLTQIFADAKLSKRQEEVARAILDGHSNAYIAQLLFVAEKTVKFHCSDIYPRLGVKTRAQLLVKYLNVRQAELAMAEVAEAQKNICESDELINTQGTGSLRKARAIALRKLPRGAMNG